MKIVEKNLALARAIIFNILLFTAPAFLILSTGCLETPTTPTPTPAPSLAASPSPRSASIAPEESARLEEFFARVLVGEKIVLPSPTPPAACTCNESLNEVIARRRSIREWSDEKISLDELSKLLYAAYGISPSGHRSVPSAHGVYPMIIYFATASGLFRYYPEWNAVQKIDDEDHRFAVSEKMAGQTWAARAPLLFIIVWDKSKMGEHERKYVDTEAGCIAQNVYLEAAMLGLGTVVIGALDEQGISRLLELPANEQAIYAMPVGHLKK